MHRKKIAAITMAAIISNMSAGTIEVLANEISNQTISVESQTNEISNQTTSIESQTNKTAEKATITKFELQNSDKLNAYNEEFKIDNSNIKSITNNGGTYPNSPIDKAIDGNLSTHWETGNPNKENFTNEVVVTFKEITTLNRIVYAARQDVSKGKGFAQQVEIYASSSDNGDDFELVATGEYNGSTGDLVEIKFNSTEFKRLKFKFVKANQDWASASEFMFYKEDTLADKINTIFTTTGMDTVSEEFNTIEKLEELEKEVLNHPLYETLKDTIDEAKDIVSGKIQNIKTVVAEQQGDRVAHANNNLKIGFGTNNQPTGVVAMPGDTITVYVDAEEGKPLPKLFFSQQEGSWASWGNTVQLKAGKNVITVPKVTQNDGWYHHSVTPGGPVYIVNPYTSDQQGKAPTIRFASGVQTFPMFDENTNEEEFLQFLKEYKEKVDADAKANPNVNDREMIDVFELVTDRIVLTATATSAYEAYIKGDFKPSESVTMYNDHMDMLFKYQGLDGSSEKNDPKYIRENIRLAQPYGFMYAAGNHTGVQSPQLVGLLTTVGGWGIDHEIGHRMDIGVRTIGEVTNNMLPRKSAAYYNAKPGNEVPYESEIYKNVIATDNNVFSEGGYFEKLGAFWQLEMVYPEYWAKLNKIYREKNITVSNENDKLDKLAYYSSMALEVDLTEYFERHGFPVTDVTKEFASKYQKPSKKIWYANTSYLNYEGEGFTDNPNVFVKTSKSGENIKVTFGVDEKYKNDVMGYEVYRDGKLIAFTSTNSFTDTGVNYNDNVTYKVVPFDKKLNEGESVEVSSYKPTLSVQQSEVTLKLREEFNPKSIVKATNYKGEDITDTVKITENINVNEKGTYEIKYSVTDENIETTKTVKVNVVSDYDYLSDYTWVSTETDYGTPRKNSNIKGRVNGDIKTFKKGFGIHANGKIVYDLSDKDYDTFEALLGVDMGIESQNNSSITFKIVGDGKTLATTKVIKHADDMVYVNVPVEGVETLSIEVYDGGNGISSDHAVIANPKLSTNNSKPELTIGKNESIKIRDEFDLMSAVKATDAEDGDLTESVVVNSNGFNANKSGIYTIEYSVTDSDGNTTTASKQVVVYSDNVYLSDLNWKSATIGSGSVRKDRAVNSNKIKLLNEDKTVKTYNKGIGTHSYSEIVYDSTGYEVFDSWVGVDRNINANELSSVVFKVYVDGELKAQSDVMRYDTPKQHLVVDVRDSKQVKLVVEVADNGNSWDHANWADAKFLITNTKPTMNVEELTVLKLRDEFDKLSTLEANDIEDGDITSKVEISGDVNTNKTGTYNLTYTITDSSDNTVTKERKVIVYSESEYLSDLNWESASAGWKTVRKDNSISDNKLKLLNEDKTVQTYNKGIGTHSHSEIVYNSNGYDVFDTWVGVDQAASGQVSSVIFKVYVDGELKAQTDVMRANTPKQRLTVDISNSSKVKLVVEQAQNGTDWDHANWADAKFLKFNSVPQLNIPSSISTKVGEKIDLNQEFSAIDAEDGDITSKVEVSGSVNFYKPGKYDITYKVIDSDGNEVVKTRNVAVVDMQDSKYLSDFDWKSETHSYAAPKKDVATSGNALRLTDENDEVVTFDKGIGAHSKSTIVYDLSDKDYAYFTSYIGVDRQMYNSVGSVSFEVYVDGVKKYDSGLMNSKDPMKYLEVDINGAKELKLVVTDGGNGNGSDHATWADAKLHFANSERESIESEARKELRKLLEYAETITEDMIGATTHIEQRWSNFISAKDTAKKCVEDFNKTDEEITNSIYELNYYISELYIESETKIELRELLEYADTINKDMIGATTHAEGKWSNFVYARDLAKQYLEDGSKTDEDFESCIFMINYYMSELELKSEL